MAGHFEHMCYAQVKLIGQGIQLAVIAKQHYNQAKFLLSSTTNEAVRQACNESPPSLVLALVVYFYQINEFGQPHYIDALYGMAG